MAVYGDEPGEDFLDAVLDVVYLVFLGRDFLVGFKTALDFEDETSEADAERHVGVDVDVE